MLSKDTEILTTEGWKSFDKLNTTDFVMCYSRNENILGFNKIEDIKIEQLTGEMINFENDDIKHLVSANQTMKKKTEKRKYDKDTGKNIRYFEPFWEYDKAEQIPRNKTIKMQTSSFHSGKGIGGTDLATLLGWIWSEGTFSKYTSISISQSSVNADKVVLIQEIMDKLLPDEHYARSRMRTYKEREYHEHIWSFTGDLAKEVRTLIPKKKLTYDLIFAMTLAEKIAFLTSAMLGDGTLKTCCLYQDDKEQLEILQTMYHLIGYRARINLYKSSVAYRRSATTQLSPKNLNKKHYENYDDLVWSITAKNNAFLVRRNNRLFISEGY